MALGVWPLVPLPIKHGAKINIKDNGKTLYSAYYRAYIGFSAEASFKNLVYIVLFSNFPKPFSALSSGLCKSFILP